VLYIDNATRMWGRFGEVSAVAPGHMRFETATLSRVILTEARQRVDDLLAAASRRVSLEDSFGTSEPPGIEGVLEKRMPVMDRPPGPVSVITAGDVTKVGDAGELAEAEQVIVHGFPQRVHQPYVRGQALPSHLLDIPGWTAWLARRDGVPAAAGFSYDDGKAVGIYWLATLPEHRSHGLARAIMAKVLAAHPDRPATLVSTEAGEPLYRSLGFATVSTATWYTLSPTG
jgi:GNAT superfamily N-acetyltransferase